MNIVSLLPSATEILYRLGLGDQVSGVTHECDYPPGVQSKQVLTRCAFDSLNLSQAEIDDQVRNLAGEGKSLYQIDEELLKKADPDLIITQDLCHVCAITPDEVERAVESLAKRPKVLSLNPVSMDDVLSDMLKIASLTKVDASAIVDDLKKRLEAVGKHNPDRRPTVGCIEWFEPIWRTGHWVPEMIRIAGGTEVFAAAGKPSRSLQWSELEQKDPDVLIMMPCGCDLMKTRSEFAKVKNLYPWDKLKSYRSGEVYFVDANAYFSRSGPRLVEGVELLAEILHPEYFSGRAPIHSYSSLNAG